MIELFVKKIKRLKTEGEIKSGVFYFFFIYTRYLVIY